MPKKTSKNVTSLFDIRLRNEHDVLVLKGSPDDAGSALLSGKILLSVNEPFTIKKLNLRLYAMIRLSWTEQMNTTKTTYPKPMRHERKIYEYNWDVNEINKYLNNMYENTSQFPPGAGSNGTGTPSLTRNSSTTSLKNLGGHFRSKSSSNLSNLGSPNGSTSNLSSLSMMPSASSTSINSGTKAGNYTLVKGNYEIPFTAILPGNMPESVEGLPGASVIYKLEANIDRGKFHNPMFAKKHVRVVRTLTTDSVELSETVAVDNTWPKKVEYSLNVPSKAIAIGSGTPISLMLVPLLKGLRLGETKITLTEYYSYMGYVPPVHNGERVIAEKTIPRPSEDDPNFQMDKWEIDTFLRVPPSLSKCTQDCDILTNVKVRHKIKFAIGLVNPDGHVSELRASLPVQLFISPFVTVSASQDQNESASDTEEHQEQILFAPERATSHTSLTNLATEQAEAGTPTVPSTSSSYTSFSGLIAPPLYEQHIYDRLWSDVSPIDSPIGSGTATPRDTYSSQSSGVHDQMNMSPIDSVQLNENLRLLSLQRQAQESSSNLPTPSDRATFSLDSDHNDYFTSRRPPISSRNSAQVLNGLLSPGAVTPAVHLSRTQSENVLNPSELSRVPSYNQSARGADGDAEVLSPAYEPPLPGSNINLSEANRNYEEYVGPRPKTPNSQSGSRGSSSFNLRALGSRNNSNNSSPSSSRNVSLTNLSSLSSSFKMTSTSPSDPEAASTPTPTPPTTSTSAPAAPTQTPPTSQISLSQTPAPTPPTTQANSVAKPSNSATDRSAALKGGVTPPIRSNSSLSLHNLHFLNKKKDKKP